MGRYDTRCEWLAVSSFRTKGRRRFRVEAIEILRRKMGLEEVSGSVRANSPDEEPAA
jgi:hypothetical protein